MRKTHKTHKKIIIDRIYLEKPQPSGPWCYKFLCNRVKCTEKYGKKVLQYHLFVINPGPF